MRSARFSITLLMLLVVCAHAEVTVVGTFPANGATDVDPAINQFRVRFSEAVGPGYSFVGSDLGQQFEAAGKPAFSDGNTVCTVPIRLKPGVKYAISINSDRHTGFRSASNTDEVVTPYVVVFTTAAGKPAVTTAPAQDAESVTVVSTFPQNGDSKVDPKLPAIRVRFSEAISPLSYSFVNTDDGEPVPFVGKPAFSDGNKLCTGSVKLEPGTSYAVSINSGDFSNLRSEAGNVPVTPYLLKFTTSGKPVHTEMTAKEWQEDLAFLASEMPKVHKNLFAKITKDVWNDKVKALNDRIPSLSEPEILVGLTALIASVGDQHTRISGLGSGKLCTLPLALYWFKDGIFVVSASDECKAALGCQVTRIGDLDIDKACEAVSPLFAHDNESARRAMTPVLLAAPDFLKWVGVASKTDVVAMTFKDDKGKTSTMDVRSVKNGSRHDLKSVTDNTGLPVPLCRTNQEMPYWAKYVEKDNLVYFQYNQCRDAQDKPFAQMRKEVEALLADHTDARLVIDLRNNGGGNSNILDPFVQALKANTNVNRKGRLFVITGRRTFSSAILNTATLQSETKAVLVGEPTGASPNGYGEVRGFKLPKSGLTVSYSTKYFKTVDKDVDAIVPDVPAEPTFAEFARGDDPVMDAILNYKAE